MDLHHSPPGLALTPASYGRACVNCAKAKCKCLTRAGSQSCERCIRLGKDCNSSTSTRRRAKNPSRLEEKVDGILELLKSGGVLEGVKGADGLMLRAAENGTKIVDDSESVENSVLQSSTSPLTGTTPNLVFSTSAPSRFSTVSGGASSSSTTEEIDHLNKFRTQVLPNFPFIHVPSSTTALELQQERPFLLLAIRAVSSKSGRQRQAFGDEIKQKIAQEVPSDNEGNLDILLGLLVFLTWGHDQLVHTQLTSRFTQFAMSMLFDLQLNRAPFKGASAVFNLGPLAGDKLPKSRTLEERRAVLGCFLLSSTVSWYFDTERNTPMDETLVVQVKLQLIAEQVIEFAGLKNIEPGRSETPRAALPFYLKALHSQLSEVQNSLSPEAEQNRILRASIHHTSISINALSLTASPDALSSFASMLRLESLTSCILSLKSWFEIYLAIPISTYIDISFPFFTQLAHCVVILHRLSVLEDPGWDRSVVRETVDILAVLERVVVNFRSLSAEGGDGGVVRADIFAKLAWIFESVRVWTRGKLVTIFGEDTMHKQTWNGEDALGLQAGFGESGDAGVDMMMVNGIDDAYLNDMLGPWSYDFL